MFHRLHTFTGHRAAVYALARGRGAGHFLSAGGDGWIAEWNLEEPDTGRVIASTEGRIFSLCIIPEQQLLVAGNMEGGLNWIHLDAPENNRNIQHHHKGVFDLLPLGDSLLSAGGDGLLTRWDARQARAEESVQLSKQALRTIAYSEMRRELAVGASDNHLYFLDSDTLEWKGVLHNAHENSVFTLAYSPDQKYLLSGGRDAWLKVWNLSEGDFSLPALSEKSPAQAAHLFTVNHITFSPDGALVATASRDKTIKIWDAESFELLKVLDTIRHGGHINSVNRLLWLEDALISASDDKSLMVWKP